MSTALMSTALVSTALVTGASAGLGRALARALAAAGWHLVIDARGQGALTAVAEELRRLTTVDALAGDVADSTHRERLARLVPDSGLDLLVHNASTLGRGGLAPLATTTPEHLRDVLETNVVAPAALTTLLLPALVRARGVVLTISSDAAVGHYESWGSYGASKAALDHVALTLAAEQPDLSVYAVDPGDMRTAMQQAAFPGEDIGDRPEPETVVPALLRLVAERPPSGRFVAAHLGVAGAVR